VSDAFPLVDLATLPRDPAPPDTWQDKAACYGIDPEIFFPPSEEDAGLALSYCGACGIRETCLAWALRNRERYGVWGGLTEQQRRRLSRHVA
jgi:WhiB family transcriptional regulator, redox-sensing transcriptional regulator